MAVLVVCAVAVSLFGAVPNNIQTNRTAINVLVTGPESSGTRYVSRSLARAINPGSKWNGEIPACWHESLSHSILHISLPWGGKCKTADLEVNPVIRYPKDFCYITKFNVGRWFVNLTTLLLNDPHARAVIPIRGETFTLPSVMKKHCLKGVSAEVIKREQAFAFSLIQESLRLFPDRVLLVHYQNLLHFPVHTWKEIFHHVGFQTEKVSFDEFKNGNLFYHVMRNKNKAVVQKRNKAMVKTNNGVQVNNNKGVETHKSNSVETLKALAVSVQSHCTRGHV